MKIPSYPRLLLITTAVLACMFAIVAWHNEIDQTTYLARPTIYALLVSSLFLGLFLLASIKKWGKGRKIQGITDNIKLYAGSVLIIALLGYMLVSTVVWLLPGTLSTYTAAYEFSARTRNGCSGATVNDPDLKRRIKACEPAGNYFSTGTLYVTKRSNALGMTVMYAATKY